MRPGRAALVVARGRGASLFPGAERVGRRERAVCILLEAIEQEGVPTLGQAAEERCARLDTDRVKTTELPEVPRGE